eukprot:EG_transcript_55666
MFGQHKDHGCVPVEQAGSCLPTVEEMEAVMQTVEAETSRLRAVLVRTKSNVETVGRLNEMELNALLDAVRRPTCDDLQLLTRQLAAIEAAQQRVAGLLARMPGAKAAVPQQLELHSLLR